MNRKIKKINKEMLEYPDQLKNIKNPPKELYYIGDLSLCERPCIAVVGSRKSTPYGKWVAYNIGKILARYGIVVVSGMATGIDSEGHRGALDEGGETIAVLGCGPDVCYPKSNRVLMDSIKEQGLIMSEYEPGTNPLPWMFPARNRIISGLSYGVVIVEADIHSGSLITAGCALDQGREVFAVPGNIDNIYSRGANKLIQDGAIPLADLEDIIKFLGIPLRSKMKQAKFSNLGEDEKIIMTLLAEHGMLSRDKLSSLCGKPANELAALLTILELKGEIQIIMGKIQVAKNIL